MLFVHIAADKDEGEEDNSQEGDGAQESKRRGQRGKKSGFIVTIEKESNTLDVVDFETAFTADPLFKKMAAAFDDGGAAGLLLNNTGSR